MRICLNCSTLEPAGFDAELDAAAAAGFRIIELRAPRLAETRDPAAALRARGLEAWAINSLEGAGEKDLTESAKRQAGWAAQTGAPYVVCVPGRRREGLEEALLGLADTCRAEGAELAFEFMGFEWSAVRTLKEALAVHSGPVVIDTFHWALGDGDLAVLRATAPDRIAVVHVNDAPAGDLRAMGDADRVPPGEGALPLADFYSSLRDIGYHGVYSIELFTPVSAERAYASMNSV